MLIIQISQNSSNDTLQDYLKIMPIEYATPAKCKTTMFQLGDHEYNSFCQYYVGKKGAMGVKVFYPQIKDKQVTGYKVETHQPNGKISDKRPVVQLDLSKAKFKNTAKKVQQEIATKAIAKKPKSKTKSKITNIEKKAIAKAMEVTPTAIKKIAKVNDKTYNVDLKNKETFVVTKEEIIGKLTEDEIKELEGKPVFKTNRALLHQYSEIFEADKIKAILPGTNNAKVIMYMFEHGSVSRNDFAKVGVESKKQISQCIAIISRKGYGIKTNGKQFSLVLPNGMDKPYIK